jgi:hypothetical protein
MINEIIDCRKIPDSDVFHSMFAFELWESIESIIKQYFPEKI